jgi:carbonic anhydrase/acetyltransferase-like protein (isoleucine patch superfamily)
MCIKQASTPTNILATRRLTVRRRARKIGRMIAAYAGRAPRLDPSAFVVESATVIGDVVIGPESSVWFGAVVRGDIESIRIGARTNVQDNATIHVVGGKYGTRLGDGVTVGHNAVVHGCTIEDGVLVGMGAIVLDAAVVGAESLVAAGALVAPGSRIPPRSLVLGTPGKVVRPINDEELERIRSSAANYVGYAQRYRAEGVR